MSEAEQDAGLQERWFVLNFVGDQENVTENPRAECFFTEKDAVSFAKESARADEDQNASYHIMRTVSIVRAERRVRLITLKPKRPR